MYKQNMRLFWSLLLWGMMCVTGAQANVKTDLQTLAKTIQSSHERMDIIDKKLAALEDKKETTQSNLDQARYNLVKAMHSLYAMDQRPLYLSFLTQKSSFLDRYYMYRTRENQTKMIAFMAQTSLHQFTEINEKIIRINHYKNEQNLLEIAVNEHLEALKTLSQTDQTSKDLQSAIDDLKSRHTTLNNFITSLVQLPALKPVTIHDSSFILPISGVIEREFTAAHAGIQIRSRARAIVTAPASGVVLYADRFKALGNIILIRHANGYISTLKGFETITVHAGQTISQNDPLGTTQSQNMGATSNGAMLYYELRYNGKVINPLTVLSGL